MSDFLTRERATKRNFSRPTPPKPVQELPINDLRIDLLARAARSPWRPGPGCPIALEAVSRLDQGTVQFFSSCQRIRW